MFITLIPNILNFLFLFRRTTKTSNLNTSWTSITNSTQGRMMETPTLLTTTVTAEHGRRLLASAALKMALDLDKIE